VYIAITKNIPAACNDPTNYLTKREVYPIKVGVLLDILLMFHKVK